MRSTSVSDRYRMFVVPLVLLLALYMFASEVSP